MASISEHYDLLIENDNDPINDDKPLQDYMDKWDGQAFINELNLSKDKRVLEIGCGTGRILKKLDGEFKSYLGIDLSYKTILRAKEHFKDLKNAQFICADFLEFNFDFVVDLIYSTLTFMHVEEKRKAIMRAYELLDFDGKFVLSIDKNQNQVIDTGYSKIKIFPDTPENIEKEMCFAGFKDINRIETELAFILTGQKR